MLRRLSLAGRADAMGDLADVVDDFFPDPPRGALFQPEPGCDVIFIGSAADVTGLAGQLVPACCTPSRRMMTPRACSRSS